ncbi:NUDIX hydrolase [Candidatus Saccharibacteria bacterium]|nr:NUDIX hydrolase [Candidatus Saccharibacteria bacterium]
MKNIYQVLVRIVYFFTWPLTGLVLHNSNRVRVLVTSKNNILLQKTSYGLQKWSVPGGGINRGELPVSAAVRELYEETGIQVSEASFREIGYERIANNKLGWPKMNVTFYSVKYTGNVTLRTSYPLEIVDLRWFSADSLPDNLSSTVPLVRKLLFDYESANK